MRVLSELEKKIIDRICEGHTHISILLTDHIPNLLFSIDKDKQTVELLFKSGTPTDEVTDKATSQTEKIIYIIKFLHYLEKEGYALTGYFSHGRAVNPIISLPETYASYEADKNNRTKWTFTDERMIDFIFRYTDITIFPTHQLKAFRQNKYRTQEDIRHNQILTVTVIAIIISLLLGLASFFQPFNTEYPRDTRHHHCNE